MLSIEAIFPIRAGLVLVPVIPLPVEVLNAFKPFGTKIIIHRPDYTEKEFEAKVVLQHLAMRGGKSKWQVVLLLPNTLRAEVPLGSQLKLNEEALARLQPPN